MSLRSLSSPCAGCVSKYNDLEYLFPFPQTPRNCELLKKTPKKRKMFCLSRKRENHFMYEFARFLVSAPKLRIKAQ
jgi:hypothetical protein